MKPFDVYPLMNINIERGQGSYVWDENDRRYLDFYGGHAVISIGHSHPYFIEAIKKQVDKTIFYSNFVQNTMRERFAEKLGQISGYDDYDLFMVNSGAEAIENALKLASFKNGRTKIVAFEKGFHGRTSAAVHITDNSRITAPINRGFERTILPWGSIDLTKETIEKGDVCSVVIEGVQGIGGIHVPSIEMLQSLRKLCDKHGTILILDEIQSGYGRTGQFFAHQYANIRPDLITIAKGMGNGFPVGGVLISPIFEANHGLLGTTFGGTHLASTAALAVIQVIEQESLIDNAKIRGNQLKDALKDISEVVEIRGKGCMLGITMPFAVKNFRKSLIENFGVFTGSSSEPNTLRLLPPLSVNSSEINLFIEAFSECIKAYKTNENI